MLHRKSMEKTGQQNPSESQTHTNQKWTPNTKPTGKKGRLTCDWTSVWFCWRRMVCHPQAPWRKCRPCGRGQHQGRCMDFGPDAEHLSRGMCCVPLCHAAGWDLYCWVTLLVTCQELSCTRHTAFHLQLALGVPYINLLNTGTPLHKDWWPPCYLMLSQLWSSYHREHNSSSHM